MEMSHPTTVKVLGLMSSDLQRRQGASCCRMMYHTSHERMPLLVRRAYRLESSRIVTEAGGSA
jgi:hypothetical protein